MPFKLRLKKSRHYNVVSKSLFVISVELLDGGSMECTLTADSIGKDCLDNVCQRLNLQQPEFFGLRYTSRNNSQLRWIELDKPLKRQLDKFAQERNLLLRVMYYITGVSLLHDEITRYHYFLQLKMDVIEGRMNCDPKQAVQLASYSMQAEFGNHEPERHTAEYLKDFALFPKHLIDEGHLDSLTESVISQHASLNGLPQGRAEEYYILAAQQLDGYGQEIFDAKDEGGTDVVIGISMSGIIVAYEQTQTSKFYRWHDITNVVIIKKQFGIECQYPDETVHFIFSNTDMSKYVWKLCVQQHTFYMTYENFEKSAEEQKMVSSLPDTVDTVTFHGSGGLEDTQFTGSREELDSHVTWCIPAPSVQRAQSTSCIDLAVPNEMEKLRALLPSYRPAPDYETAVQHKYHHHQQQHNVGNINMRPNNHQVGMLFSSQPEIHQTNNIQENLTPFNHYPDVAQVKQFYEGPQRLIRKRGGEYVSPPSLLQNPLHTYSTPELDTLENHLMRGLQLIHLYKPPPPYPINRPSSNSTPDLASQGLAPPQHIFIGNQVSGSSPDLVSSKNLKTGRAHARLVRSQMLPNPDAHRTYTNLAAALDPNIMSHMGSDLGILLENESAQYHSQVQEPIYENVPLPWVIEERNYITSSREDVVIRSRASSVQSAPEMSSTNLIDYKFMGNSKSSAVNFDKNTAQNIHYDHHGQNMQKSVVNQEIRLQNKEITLENSKEQTPLPAATKKPENGNYKSHQQYGISWALPSEPDKSTAIDEESNRNSECLTESKTEASPSSSSIDSDRQKPRKKWALLVGGKAKSRASSKSDTLTEENRSSALKHRWSTGLPRLPLPATVSKETMCHFLERKVADGQLFFEFEKIPKKKCNSDFVTALLSENITRNRYKDVLPYEENRVRLSPTKENRYGYVNASRISISVGNQQRFYIAAQSPMPNTVTSFWQMVWESDVYLIVMLCATQDDGCSPYLPPIGNRCLDLGEFQIWQHLSQETGHCITSSLKLLHASRKQARNVWHMQYCNWGDQGCPSNVSHFLGFLEELSSVRRHTISEIPAGHNRNPPVLIHCSAGVGRTGLVIAGDLLLLTLDHNQELDIPRTVAVLRNQRMFMVQTIAQYRFIYNLLIYYMKHSRLI